MIQMALFTSRVYTIYSFSFILTALYGVPCIGAMQLARISCIGNRLRSHYILTVWVIFFQAVQSSMLTIKVDLLRVEKYRWLQFLHSMIRLAKKKARISFRIKASRIALIMDTTGRNTPEIRF